MAPVDDRGIIHVAYDDQMTLTYRAADAVREATALHWQSPNPAAIMFVSVSSSVRCYFRLECPMERDGRVYSMNEM